jgi:hypothetical protein
VIEEDIPNLSYNMLPGLIILVLHFTAVGLTAGQYLQFYRKRVIEACYPPWLA